ncbi:MAG: hypothetical protein LHV68_08470 [Elusimicrobia bacterium]|nr:hypothetical protein [Candidatus Liberimonas magnetica]
MFSKLARVLEVLICTVLIAQFLGCGTILYPQRRGQHAGKIDAGVAVMDGVGLLLFVIPGIIAFAVDFGTGAIYLPGTSRSSLDVGKLNIVKFDPKNWSYKGLENIIRKETGFEVKFNQPNMRIVRLKSDDDVKIHLAKAFKD